MPDTRPLHRHARHPDFIYVGLPKSGSTWLHQALREHPGAFVPEAKSIEFFDRHFERGLDWYLKHFAGAGAAQVIGELSHDTMTDAAAVRRIRCHFPRMRLIVCLREPGALARSVLLWWLNHTDRFGRTVSEMTAQPHYRALLAYQENLERLYAQFPPTQILVLFHENLCRDPHAFIASVYQFIGLDASFVPRCVTAVINPTRPARHPTLARLIYRLGLWSRNAGAGTVVEKAKSSPKLQSILYRDPSLRGDETAVACAVEEARAAVWPHHGRLEFLIGRALPAEWKVGAPPA